MRIRERFFLEGIFCLLHHKNQKTSALSVSADNICRGCCSALVLLPRLFSVDIADWVSSRDVMYSRGLCCQKPDQARLASSQIMALGVQAASGFYSPNAYNVFFIR